MVFCSLALSALAAITSCGGSSSKKTNSGISYRALISNPLFAGTSPALQIVNAQNDSLSPSAISLAGDLSQPSRMTLSPSKQYTMVYSPAATSVVLVNNTTEAVAQGSSAIPLPGASESMLIASDNATGYAAVPGAPSTTGLAPGAVVQLSLLTGQTEATLAIPSAHYIAAGTTTSEILVFSDNSDAITVISPILIGTTQNPITTITSPDLDRPVGAVFSSDNSTAYIFNCGPECGGKQASIATLQTLTNQITGIVPVSGATVGLISGSTLYVAGSPAGTACPAGTAATSCGVLTLVDTGSLAVTNSSPILITDGRHDHLELSADGQLFIGSHSCSNVNISGGETRGCLSIFNTTTSMTVVPAFAGDVTGIAPIPGRTIVYVIQNATLEIFDTRTDQIEVQSPVPLNIVGQPYDVKYVDSPVPD